MSPCPGADARMPLPAFIVTEHCPEVIDGGSHGVAAGVGGNIVGRSAVRYAGLVVVPMTGSPSWQRRRPPQYSASLWRAFDQERAADLLGALAQVVQAAARDVTTDAAAVVDDFDR